MAASSLLGDRSMYQLTLQDIESGEQDVDDQPDELYKREAWLRDQYHSLDRTPTEIAEEADTTHGTVEYWLKKYYIIPADEQVKNLPDVRLLKDRDALYQRYVEESYTSYELAEELDVSNTAVLRALQAHNINIRSKSDGAVAAMEHPYDDLHDEQWLQHQYVELGKSGHQIAVELGCCNHTVYRWLDKHDIETRNTGQPTGEDHPDYSGGSFPYGPGWTAKKRRSVRSRDGYECVRCGISQQQHQQKYEQKLHVHHITPARQVDDPEERNAMDNLVALCKTCHDTVEEFTKAGLSVDFRSG